MSIFETIKNAIFHHSASAAPTAAAAPPAAGAGKPSPAAAPPSPPVAPASGAAQGPVDVEAVLNGLSAKSSQQLNWQTSIVDLMKLLGLDSSLQNRKELAKELGYTGDAADSAAMNVWLHKQVMNKLAENGGKVPASLRS